MSVPHFHLALAVGALFGHGGLDVPAFGAFVLMNVFGSGTGVPRPVLLIVLVLVSLHACHLLSVQPCLLRA